MPTCWHEGSGTLEFCQLLCFPTADYEAVSFKQFQLFEMIFPSDYEVVERCWQTFTEAHAP